MGRQEGVVTWWDMFGNRLLLPVFAFLMGAFMLLLACDALRRHRLQQHLKSPSGACTLVANVVNSNHCHYLPEKIQARLLYEDSNTEYIFVYVMISFFYKTETEICAPPCCVLGFPRDM